MKMAAWLKISCKDTSPMISEMMDHTLPFSKRLRVKFHLAICEVCRYYQEQLKILRALANRLGQEEAPTEPETKLSPEAREKIRQALNQTP